MTLLRALHNKLIFKHRVNVLVSIIEPLIPANAKILDIGCGDGTISHLITKKRPDITITGIDILKRDYTHIPVQLFDGRNIPFEDNSFDGAILIDMLHHTNHPEDIIAEAKRVSSKCIIIKDHIINGTLDDLTLRFMDWIGNAPHGVTLPYNYLTEHKWKEIIQAQKIPADFFDKKISLYKWPISIFFNRTLHVVMRLKTDQK